MANPKEKREENVSGPYYVDRQCIACDACVMEAPDFFEIDENGSFAWVKKQPNTKEDIENCENAMASCPVDAIGNDGAS